MIEQPDLDQLLKGEGVSVEWKENVADHQDVVRTLCAFANDLAEVGGGWVVCGVVEAKDAHGFAEPRPAGLTAGRLEKIKGKVLADCRQKVSPPLTPAVHQLPVDSDSSRRLLVFSVGASPWVHAYRSRDGGTRYWFRTNSTTHEDRGENLLHLLARKGQVPPFLEQPCPDASVENDLDLRVLEEMVTQMGLPLPTMEYLKPEVRIEAAARPLVVEQPLAPGTHHPVPTKLALLLAGKDPLKFLPGARAVIAVFDGVTRSEDHSERFELYGPLPRLIREVLEKLRAYTGIVIDKSSDMLKSRQNRPRYSQKALDEAVVNAFVHRDYRSDDPTVISVFADRLEITNPGGLVSGLDPESVASGRAPATWRNSSLAAFLFRLGLAQRLGIGLETILKETLLTSGKRPTFSVTKAHFTIVLPAVASSISFAQRPSPNQNRGSSDGLLLVSMGGASHREAVVESLEELGLSEARILVDYAYPAYIEQSEWEDLAREIRDAVSRHLEDPGISRFHLFYRGPVVIAPLLGALATISKKPMHIYHYEGGRYNPAYTLERRFLIPAT